MIKLMTSSEGVKKVNANVQDFSRWHVRRDVCVEGGGVGWDMRTLACLNPSYETSLTSSMFACMPVYMHLYPALSKGS